LYRRRNKLPVFELYRLITIHIFCLCSCLCIYIHVYVYIYSWCRQLLTQKLTHMGEAFSQPIRVYHKASNEYSLSHLQWTANQLLRFFVCKFKLGQTWIFNTKPHCIMNINKMEIICKNMLNAMNAHWSDRYHKKKQNFLIWRLICISLNSYICKWPKKSPIPRVYKQRERKWNRMKNKDTIRHK